MIRTTLLVLMLATPDAGTQPEDSVWKLVVADAPRASMLVSFSDKAPYLDCKEGETRRTGRIRYGEFDGGAKIVGIAFCDIDTIRIVRPEPAPRLRFSGSTCTTLACLGSEPCNTCTYCSPGVDGGWNCRSEKSF